MKRMNVTTQFVYGDLKNYTGERDWVIGKQIHKST